MICLWRMFWIVISLGCVMTAAAGEMVTVRDVRKESQILTGAYHRQLEYLWQADSGTTCTAVLRHSDHFNTWYLLVPEGVEFLHNTNWKDEVGSVSADETLKLLSAVLEDFNSRETSGSLTSIHIGFHIIPEVWEPFLVSLREKLKPLPATAQPSLSLLGKKADEALLENPFLKKLASTVEQAGYRINYGPSHGGEKTPYFDVQGDWDKVLEKPDLGLLSPGNISIHLHEPQQ